VRADRKRVDLIRNILRNLFIGWLCFVFLWIVLALAKRPPSSFIIPETLNYSLFWMVGVMLIGLLGFFFVMGRLGVDLSGWTEEGTSLKDLLALTPYEFEDLVADTYRAFGYQVQRIAVQGDFGIDMVLKSSKGAKSVVLCRHKKGNIGEQALHEFFYAMQREEAREGAVITTGAFTPEAREWAREKPIHLYDGKAFLKVLRQAQRMSTPESSGEPSGRAP
jgi:hypothetical protein